MDEPGPSSSSSFGYDATSREAMYKNRGMTSDVMRKRREEACAEIRKARRLDDLNKRRQIDLAPPEIIEDPDYEPESNAQSCSAWSQVITMADHEQPCTAMDERIIAKLYGECTREIEESLDFYRRRFRTSNFSAAYFLNGNASDVADEIVALNIIPRIVELLHTGPSLNIRRTATHVIGAIVSICSTHTEAIVKSGVVPYLIDLIGNPDRELRELTLFALGNIAAECCEYRDLCIEYGMAQKMTMIPDGMTLMEARCAVWAASNLCRGKEPPVDLEKISVLLPLFNEALYSNDTLIISDACRAFGRLLDAIPESSYKYILKPSTVECLVEHMGNPNSKISLAALLAVGNIVSGDDEQTQNVVCCTNALNNIHRLLLDGDQKRSVKYAGYYRILLLACWVIANAVTGGSKEHITRIVNEGALTPLSDMLTVMDCSVVVVVLKTLAGILECGESYKGGNVDDTFVNYIGNMGFLGKCSSDINGKNPYSAMLEELNVIDKLEFLMLSTNTEIFFKACAIMEKYYLCDDDEQDEAASKRNSDAIDSVGKAINHFNFS
ncbi:Importin subunit alpha [Dirofilaria immitis]|nr:Importin subunit alpha [Dirofilaria immitis]